MKHIIKAALLCAALMSNHVFAAISYRDLISLKSVYANNRNLWIHGGCRDWEGDTGNAQNTPHQIPRVDREVLISMHANISADNRQINGAHIIMLVDPENKYNKDAIKYGDKVSLISFFAGAGYGEVSGFRGNGLVWWANAASRWTTRQNAANADGGYAHQEIIVSEPHQRSQTSDGSEVFELRSGATPAKTGPIQEGDTVVLVSKSSKGDGIVWVAEGSRWGNNWRELLINDWKQGAENRARSGTQSHLVISKVTRNNDTAVVYDQIMRAPAYTAEPVIPAGMVLDTGDVTSITCGSSEGKPVVLALNEDQTVMMRYDFKSMSENAWVVTPLKQGDTAVRPAQIAVASDGTALVLDQAGKVYKITDIAAGKVEAVPTDADDADITFDRIAVGSKDAIFGVDTDTNNLYRHNGTGWVEVTEGVVSDVAAALDGTVVALNTAGRAYMKDVSESKGDDFAWMELGEVAFDAIAVASKDVMYGVARGSGAVFKWDGDSWEMMKATGDADSGGLREIAINAAGYLIACDGADNFYDNGKPVGVEIKVVAPATPETPAVIESKPAASETARAEAKKTGKVKPKKQKAADKKGKKAGKKAAKKGAKKAAKKAASKKAKPMKLSKKGKAKQAAKKDAAKKAAGKKGAKKGAKKADGDTPAKRGKTAKAK